MRGAQKPLRKEVVAAATRLYKSGVLPTEPKEGQLTRVQRRQLERALGYRGSKAKRHNTKRQMAKFREVMAVEQVLDIAQDRVEHPIRARLRGI